MSIRIVTDSTCDLPESVVQEHGIRVMPLYIHIGTKDYLDGVELSREEFYNGLPTYESPPTTAAPGIGAFTQVYEQLAAEGATGIVSIHISETLSNVVNVAQLAAQKTETIPVRVIDSGQLSLGVGVMGLAPTPGLPGAPGAAPPSHAAASAVPKVSSLKPSPFSPPFFPNAALTASS